MKKFIRHVGNMIMT